MMPRPARSLPGLLLAIVAPVLVVGGLYLAPFLRDADTMPFGYDTAGYVWRAEMVHGAGVASLTPDAFGERKALGYRPAYPVLLSLLRSGTGASPLAVAWVIPAAMAALIALGAGAMASDGLLEGRGRSGAVAVAVGGSSFIAWTAVGYATALAFDVIAIALAVVVLRMTARGRGVAAGALLLASGVLYHWMFAVVLAGVVAAFALLLAAGRRWVGDRSWGPPSGGRRLGWMLLGAAVLGGIGLLFAPELPGHLPHVRYDGPGSFTFIRERLPSMALWWTVPAAAIGAALLAGDRRPLRRWGVALPAIWASLAVVGLFAWYVLHLPAPPYRWAGFAFVIPALIVLGALAVWMRAGSRWGRSGTAAGIGLTAVAVAACVVPGVHVWWDVAKPRMDAAQLAQVSTVADYLSRIPAGTPVLFLTNPSRGNAPLDLIRAGLPAERISDASVASARVRADGSLVAPDGAPLPETSGTVIVVLDTLLGGRPTGTQLADGITLVSGPVPPSPSLVAPLPRAPSGPALVGLWALIIAILGAVGSGWVSGLTDLGGLGRIALAPAFGMAVLGFGGTVASRLGVPLRDGGAIGVLLVGVGAGWVVWWIARRTARRAGDGPKITPEPVSAPLAERSAPAPGPAA